jgi:hypothetical protein
MAGEVRRRRDAAGDKHVPGKTRRREKGEKGRLEVAYEVLVMPLERTRIRAPRLGPGYEPGLEKC